MKMLRSLLTGLALIAGLALRADPAPDLSFLPRAVGAVEIVAWDGFSYVAADGRTYWSGVGTPTAADLDSALATPRAAPAAPAPAVWSALVFFERFTESEQLAIFETGDADVRLFRAKLLAAQEVRGDDPRTIGGLDLLIAKGLLTSARKTAILTP